MVVGSIAWLQGAESTTFFVDPMPVGTTATVSFATEASGSADTLLDHDPKTALVAKQGTAQEGKSVSIFLRFPKEVPGLSGVVLGQSDQFGNYVWQQMEFWADTTGNGTYDTKLGSAKGPAAGQHRFPMAAMPVKGLELRVTKQSIKGTRRAFSLNGIDGLVMADSSGSGEMRYVIEDVEDLSSWRTWADNSAQPEGERSYG